MKITSLLALLLALGSIQSHAQEFVTFNAGKRIVLKPDPAQTHIRLAQSGAIVADAVKQELQQPRPGGFARLKRPVVAGLKPLDEAVQSRAAVSALLRNSQVAFAAPVLRSAEGHELSPTSSLLVKLKPGQTMAKFLQVLRNPAIVNVRQISRDGVHKLTTNLRDGAAVMDLAATLVKHPMVKMAQADFSHEAVSMLVPNDPFFFSSAAWGFSNSGNLGGLAGFDMNAVKAWDVTTGSSAIIVAIFDGGIQQDHPEINQIPGRDFTDDPITNGGTPAGSVAGHDHGTMVASCVSARINNARSACGIAPDVRCVSVRWGVPDGEGHFIGNDSNVIEGLEWAQSIGARVSVHSYGMFPSWALDEVFESTREAGMIHFAATGNDAHKIFLFEQFPAIAWPASSPYVLAVGAARRDGVRAPLSRYGGDTRRVAQSVDFMAPGEEVAVVARTGTPGVADTDALPGQGTSFAAPYAAGVAALLLSQNPALTPAQVEARMIAGCQNMGTRGWDRFTGYGLVDAFRSMADDHGDTPATSTRVALNSVTRGHLNREDDADCIRFTVPATLSIVRMHMNALFRGDILTPSAATTVEVLNENGTRATFTEIPVAPRDSSVVFPGAGLSGFKLRAAFTPGSYVLRVRGLNSAMGSYELVLSEEDGQPEISVLGNNSVIADGDTTPATADGTQFGTVRAGTSVTRTFTIRNDGQNILRVTNANNIDGNRVLTPVIQPGSAANGVRDIPVPEPKPVPAPIHFRVTSMPVAQILPGRSATFIVTFKPVGTGFFTHTLRIQSNDQDEREYDFVISGGSLLQPSSVR
ncbi:MAG TPA: S8 family serine peptidase [Prosthecobacter sp.]|nr:S8 family serine peptidase [Prosthecobacter sp.]HRK16922.1 S8 family serine peptidase [Prosthecobacter sp.]